MAVSSGREVGRVSIRVIPNATKFRNDLKLLLKRVEGSMVANLRVAADTREATQTIARFRREAEQGVNIQLDTRKATTQLDKLRRDVQKNAKLSLDVDAKTAGASANIARVARPRTVTLNLAVAKASIVKVGSVLAALSGGRLLGDVFGNLAETIGNIDRNLPKIALMATGIASLGSAALSSLTGLISLGAGLAQLAGLGLVLPGIFGGFLASLAVMIVVLKRAPDVLEPLKQSFVDLGDTINEQFWARAADPIMNFVNGVLPQLSGGLGAVGNSLGEFAKRLADSFGAAFAGDRLATMFNSLAQAIDIAFTGTDAFAQSITTLGTFGAAYLPRLAQFFVDIGTQFNNWLQQAAGDGRLNVWVENGITALGQLASSIGSIGSIFAGINDAAMAAGGGGLATFAAVLATVAEIINGEAFQTALTTILHGANAGFSALGSALVPIGNAIATLAPTISGILTTAGEALGGFLTAIAGALETPAFQHGLSNFFDGIKTGLDAIGPSLPRVAAALGTLGTFVGELAAFLGPVLGTALAQAAPLFSQLLAQVSPLIPVLGQALIESINALAPALLTVANEVIPPLVSAIIELAPLLPSLVEFFSQLLIATAPIAGQLLETLLPAFVALTPALTTMLEALTPLLQYLPLLATQVQILAAVISTVLVVAFGIAQVIWTTFTALITGDWSNFAQNITDITKGMGDGIAKAWQGFIDSIVKIFTDGAAQATQIGTDLGHNIRGLFDGAGSWLVDAGRSIIQGLINGISSMIARARDAVSGVLGAVSNLFPHSPAKEGPFSGRGWTLYSGRATVDGYIEGIASRKARLRSTVADTLGAASLTMSSASTALRDAPPATGFPGEVTLLDKDGSILTKAKVIADDTVAEDDDDTRVGLENGKRR